LFSEVSARNGTGIQELFTNLAGTLPGNDTSQQVASGIFPLFFKNTHILGGQSGAGTNQKGNVVLENPTQGDEEVAKKKGGCC